MPLIYKPYQATLANKEGQKLYYPRLVKFGKMVNTQKMAELIAEKASLTAGDVHNVIRNLMSVITCSPTSKSFKKSINNSFSTSLPNKNLKPKSVKGLINLPIICCVSIIKQR